MQYARTHKSQCRLRWLAHYSIFRGAASVAILTRNSAIAEGSHVNDTFYWRFSKYAAVGQSKINCFEIFVYEKYGDIKKLKPRLEFVGNDWRHSIDCVWLPTVLMFCSNYGSIFHPFDILIFVVARCYIMQKMHHIRFPLYPELNLRYPSYKWREEERGKERRRRGQVTRVRDYGYVMAVMGWTPLSVENCLAGVTDLPFKFLWHLHRRKLECLELCNKPHVGPT